LLLQGNTLILVSGTAPQTIFSLPTGDVPYYMASSGCSDSYDGKETTHGSGSTGPWCTPNHAVNCGDVIIAQSGTYSGSLAITTSASSCPSTTGGIDGTGGVYFATVVCQTAFACSDTGASGNVFDIAANNWAVEGWVAGATGYAYLADATATGTTQYHYIAFINDISENSHDGFGTGDGGKNHNVPGNGIDEFAVVGSIAVNANNDPICVAAIDDPGPANFIGDSTTGTHVFWSQNFSYAGLVHCATDGEGFMFDTWDAHGYTGQGIAKNNIAWDNARYGFNYFYQNFNSSNPVIKIYNNTFYANNQYAGDIGTGSAGEINTNNSSGTAIPWTTYIYNNIAQTNYAHQGNNGSAVTLYALLVGSNVPGTNFGNQGSSPANSQNIFWAISGSCVSGSCDTTDSATAYGGESYGTNTYESAAFNNVSDLLTNWVSAPNCSGYATTVACMGWNGSSATANTPIYDLTPTVSGSSGKGYQPPSTACASDPDYPPYLKGIVYLSVSGTTIYENSGLITKPCGL
jgi:hypothetical protein